MSLSRMSILAMFVVALAGPHAAFGQFSAAFTLTGDAQDPANVFPMTPLAVTVTDAQTYGTNYWNNDISRLQLNWSNSSAGLNLSTGATWAWGAPVLGLIAPPPHVTINDTNLSDGLVNIQNMAGITIVPASPFVVGVLGLNAPAYNPLGGNTYTLNLTGGSYDDETLTAVIDVMPVNPGDPDGVLLAPPGTGLTLSTYTFTVIPGGKWTGGSSTAWQTSGNWSSAMTPGSTFTAVFDGPPTANQPALGQSESASSLLFKTAGWTISGSSHTLTVGTGGISSAGGSTNSIEPTIAFTGNAVITVTGATHTLNTAALNAGGFTLAKAGDGTLAAGAVTANVLNVNAGTAEIASLTGSGADLEANIAASKTLTVTGTAGMTNLNLVAVEGTVDAGDNPVTTTDTGEVRIGMTSPAASLTAGDVTANKFNLNQGSASVKNLYGDGTNPTAMLAAGTNFAMRASNITGWKDITANTNVNAHSGAISATGTVTNAAGKNLLAGSLTAGTFLVNGTSTLSGAVNASSTTVATTGLLTAASHTGTDLTVYGTATYAGGLALAGTATVGNSTNAATLSASTLVADTLTIRDQAKVTTAINGTANEVAKVNHLNFDGTPDVPLGQWDTRMGKFVIEYNPATTRGEVEDTIRKLVLSGMTSSPSGYWDGNGIMSSDAANDTGAALHAVAFIDNRYIDPNDPENPIQLFKDWGGVTVTMTAILGMYTYFGDADMNGTVNGNDYTLTDNGFNAGLKGWINGDFDYSGAVDGGDYTLIDNAYNVLNPGIIGGAHELLGAVPEPATLGLMALGGLALLGSRRK